MELTLTPHPDTPCPAVRSLRVMATREGPSTLALGYTVMSQWRDVLYSDSGEPGRSHELWLHTCMEAFIQSDDGSYREVNLSFAEQWAVYAFSGYREGMRVDEAASVTDLEQAIATSGPRILRGRVNGLPAGNWKVGLSAIIETIDGQRHFFALNHPPGEPDFHHPDAFSLDMPA